MNNDLLGRPVEQADHLKPLGARDHLTFRGNVSVGRHGWLRLTPAYSLHVVREIVENSGNSEYALDPFSGTGTTPLVCAALGIPCDAVDINPFLVWLGNLKASRFPPETPDVLKEAGDQVVACFRSQCRSAPPWVPAIHNIDKWWSRDVLNGLARLFQQIQGLKGASHTYVSDLLKIAFCRVMIGRANVSFGHQSMSFKPRKETGQMRFPNLSEPSVTEGLIADFLGVTDDIGRSLLDDQPRAKSRVFLGDSRELDRSLPGPAYTLVITSPPYPNRMSYIRELRPYMYWLGFLANGRQAGELDWKAIGGTWGCATSLLSSWEPRDGRAIPYAEFNRIIQGIGRKHEILARYVHKYFEDIAIHVRSLRSILAPRARCFYIVGNSKFYDTLVPVERIYASLFEATGFINIRTKAIRKRTSKKELYEYIVMAELPA